MNKLISEKIDDMYYVGDIVDVDGDGWVDKETFEILLREYQFELKELKRAMAKYLKKLTWYRKNHKKLYRPVGENFKFIK
tara:strand:- start:241 stop:480 length:240 start_codon:yes stop_codon:yes gene_type:complete